MFNFLLVKFEQLSKKLLHCVSSTSSDTKYHKRCTYECHPMCDVYDLKPSLGH